MKTILHVIIILFGFVIYTFMFVNISIFFLSSYFLFLTPFKPTIILIIKELWLKITIALFYLIFPKEIKIAINKKCFKKKKVIIISNHLTNFDWIIIMRVLYELNMFDNCYFVLKESLSKIPFIGFCMKAFGFIFLKRNWAEDEKTLKNQISSIVKDDYSIVIFPEGTFLDKEAKEKLDLFLSGRKKEDIKIYPKYTLYPKTRGFNKIYELTKGNLDGIIDITIVPDPHCEFPADEFSYMNVFFKKPGSLKTSVVVDFYGPFIKKEFIFESFKRKNLIFETLIRKKNRSIENLVSAFDELKENGVYVYETIFMIPNGVYTFFLYSFIFILMGKVKDFF